MTREAHWFLVFNSSYICCLLALLIDGNIGTLKITANIFLVSLTIILTPYFKMTVDYNRANLNYVALTYLLLVIYTFVFNIIAGFLAMLLIAICYYYYWFVFQWDKGLEYEGYSAPLSMMFRNFKELRIHQPLLLAFMYLVFCIYFGSN